MKNLLVLPANHSSEVVALEAVRSRAVTGTSAQTAQHYSPPDVWLPVPVTGARHQVGNNAPMSARICRSQHGTTRLPKATTSGEE